MLLRKQITEELTEELTKDITKKLRRELKNQPQSKESNSLKDLPQPKESNSLKDLPQSKESNSFGSFIKQKKFHEEKLKFHEEKLKFHEGKLLDINQKIEEERKKTTNDIQSEWTRRAKNKLKIYKHDLFKLDKSNWLNDSIIEAILHQICNTASYRKVIALSPFLFTKLLEEDPTFFTKTINIFNYENILIPVCIDKHWILGHFNPKNGNLQIHDPYQTFTQTLKVGQILTKWLLNEGTRTKSKLKIINFIPSQLYKKQPNSDSSNCGIFIAKYANSIVKNKEPNLYNIEQTRKKWKRILIDELYIIREKIEKTKKGEIRILS